MKLQHIFVVFCLFVIAACSTDQQTTDHLAVKVIDGQGKGIANVTVVVGNQAGELKSYVTTNDRGEAYFNSLPSNATVTAAFSCYSSSADRTYYYIDTTYDVNVAALNLSLGTCEQLTQTVDVKVTNKVAGVTYSEVTLGPITYGGTDVNMDVYELQDDGNISVFATGYDDDGDIKGYGFALDQPAIDGSMIDVVIDRTDLVQHTHSFANVPSSTVSYYAFASLLRKHAQTNLPLNFISNTAPVPAAITTYAFDGFSDNNMFGAGVMLDQDSDGNSDGEVGLARYVQKASDQVFDFSSAPALPGDLAYDQGTIGRPIIFWSNKDASSTAQKLIISYRSDAPERTSSYYYITAPASATSLVFPELPDMLSAFRPSAYSNLSLETLKFDRPASYNDYLEAVAKYNGRFYEAVGLSSYGYAGISRMP